MLKSRKLCLFYYEQFLSLSNADASVKTLASPGSPGLVVFYKTYPGLKERKQPSFRLTEKPVECQL